MSQSKSFFGSIAAEIDAIHDSWGWFVALGIALIILGVVCISSDVIATLATVLVFGWALLIGGIFALIQAFRTRTWSGFFLCLLSALLRGFTGYLLIRYPIAGEISLTLLLASFFIVGGTFRAIGAGALQFPQWGWSALSGIVSVALGVMPARAVAGIESVVHRLGYRHRFHLRRWRLHGARRRAAQLSEHPLGRQGGLSAKRHW